MNVAHVRGKGRFTRGRGGPSTFPPRGLAAVAGQEPMATPCDVMPSAGERVAPQYVYDKSAPARGTAARRATRASQADAALVGTTSGWDPADGRETCLSLPGNVEGQIGLRPVAGPEPVRRESPVQSGASFLLHRRPATSDRRDRWTRGQGVP